MEVKSVDASTLNFTPIGAAGRPAERTRSYAVAEGPRDASCQLKSCQLLRNSAETTCTTSPEQIEVMKLETKVGRCVVNMYTQP